ncbi:TRAP transporter substrate-binding protein [Roseibium marinum]|uniref:TRAP-type C4-dicarboxylate transport system substrate-binding protein n=1 Tax=Roseibium marinum TaxID=281252 RepID=A0A2S3UJM7_9HYPH|nr:TRAP transporter substrate-binding protein [Roseibium marinum]POF27897.1 TRAP-type C4-dicarboxylate transport system substrate-binding protein [Roseibium marinum]
MMKLNTITAAGVLLAGMLSGPAVAETLKVTTFLPPVHTFVKAINAWGEELADRSGGEIEMEVYPAGQLGPPPRQFDIVRAGVADIAIFLHAVTPGRFPMTELAGLPLTHPSEGDGSAITSRRLTELAPEYLAGEHEGTHILWMAVTPPLKVNLAKADPRDLDNLKGLRLRYAGSTWQQIVEALGASPVPVPPAETADAIGKGIVDGATFPFEATMAFDLGPVIEYSMEPGLASATFAVVMSDAAYNRLSAEHRKLIDETTGPDRAAWFGALWDKGEEEGRKYMVDSGVDIVTLNAAQVEGLQETFASIVVAGKTAAGDNAQAFLDAYTK